MFLYFFVVVVVWFLFLCVCVDSHTNLQIKFLVSSEINFGDDCSSYFHFHCLNKKCSPDVPGGTGPLLKICCGTGKETGANGCIEETLVQSHALLQPFSVVAR